MLRMIKVRFEQIRALFTGGAATSRSVAVSAVCSMADLTANGPVEGTPIIGAEADLAGATAKAAETGATAKAAEAGEMVGGRFGEPAALEPCQPKPDATVTAEPCHTPIQSDAEFVATVPAPVASARGGSSFWTRHGVKGFLAAPRPGGNSSISTSSPQGAGSRLDQTGTINFAAADVAGSPPLATQTRDIFGNADDGHICPLPASQALLSLPATPAGIEATGIASAGLVKTPGLATSPIAAPWNSTPGGLLAQTMPASANALVATTPASMPTVGEHNTGQPLYASGGKPSELRKVRTGRADLIASLHSVSQKNRPALGRATPKRVANVVLLQSGTAFNKPQSDSTANIPHIACKAIPIKNQLASSSPMLTLLSTAIADGGEFRATPHGFARRAA